MIEFTSAGGGCSISKQLHGMEPFLKNVRQIVSTWTLDDFYFLMQKLCFSLICNMMVERLRLSESPGNV